MPAGPIYKVDEMFVDPQVEHLRIAVPLNDPVRGDVRVIGQPVSLSRTPAAVVSSLPEAGEHSAEVLREAGYDQAEIDRFRQDGIV